MARKKTPSNRVLIMVSDRLIGDTFDGTRKQLADEIGIGVPSLQCVLDHVRTPEFIAEHHWTVPYVQRGGQTNRWRIVDIEDNVDNETMKESQQRRAQEMLATTRRNIAQCTLAMVVLDGRSKEARHWQRAMVAQQATEAHLEQLLEI